MIVIPEYAAIDAGLLVCKTSRPYTVHYGNGSVSYIDKICFINGEKCLVDKNVSDTLIAVNQLTKGHNELIFKNGVASVRNDLIQKEIPLIRTDDGQWRMSLHDVSQVLSWAKDEAAHAQHVHHTHHIYVNIRVVPKNKRRKLLNRLVRIHRIMGHPNVDVMYKAIKSGQWTNSGVDPEMIKPLWNDESLRLPCIVCIMAKRNKLPKSIASDVRTVKPGAVQCCDPVSCSIPGVDGATMIFLFKDIATGMWKGTLGKTKDEFLGHLQNVIRFYKGQGHFPETLRTDDEIVLKSHEVMEYLEANGISSQRSVPYQHYQNSVERDVQTLVKMICAVMHDQPLLHARFWDYCFYWCVDLHNRLPNASTGVETPRSLVMKNDSEKTTNLSNTFNFYFGEIVAVSVPRDFKPKEWTFDTRREIGIYVGQPPGQVDGHYVYMPFEDHVYVRGDLVALNVPPHKLATFYATKTGIRKGKCSYKDTVELFQSLGYQTKDDPVPLIIQRPTHIPPPAGRIGTRSTPASSNVARIHDSDQLYNDYHSNQVQSDVEIPDVGIPLSTTSVARQSCCTVEDEPDYLPDLYDSDDEGPEPESEPAHASVSRTSIPSDGAIPSPIVPDANETKWTSTFSEVHDRFSNESIHNYCFGARSHGPNNPTTGKALKAEDRQKWIQAIRDEILINMFQSGTLEEAFDVPDDALITYLTLVLKKKIKEGQLPRYKARSCFRGDLLAKLISATYSPTVGVITSALLQQLSVIDELATSLVDTVGAFLAQDYPDENPALYVKIDKVTADICGLDHRKIYRVRKYIYGIPDAGRAYYKAYSATLEGKGYTKSKVDPCLFFKHYPNGEVLYAFIHVDDTWVCATKQAGLDQFVKDVESRYEVTVEPVTNYLGVHYEKLPDGSLKRTQHKMLDDLVEKHGLTDKPSCTTPSFSPSAIPPDLTPVSVTVYLCLLGSLLYLLFSRPDIGFAVSWAATKAANPTEYDWKNLVRILQYLYQTRAKGLILRKQPKGCKLQLHVYVDASYLLYDDSKAQTGYVLTFNNIGSWYSKSSKQSVVTTSSTHSEVRAMFTSVCDCLFAEMLADEIGRPLTMPTIIEEDNQPTVTLVNRDSAPPKMSKHFLMLINYIRELIALNKFEVRKILTELNLSDIYTKHVQGKDYQYKAQGVLSPGPYEPILEPIKRPAPRVTDFEAMNVTYG